MYTELYPRVKPYDHEHQDALRQLTIKSFLWSCHWFWLLFNKLYFRQIPANWLWKHAGCPITVTATWHSRKEKRGKVENGKKQKTTNQGLQKKKKKVLKTVLTFRQSLLTAVWWMYLRAGVWKAVCHWLDLLLTVTWLVKCFFFFFPTCQGRQTQPWI